MFALLAMLKTVADTYKLASVKQFRRLKLYFVQPSACCIRLWSMQYAKHGIYNFVREDREVQLAPLVNFYLNLKNHLEDAMKAISTLKEQHVKRSKEYDSENCSQAVFLSDIICPKIFKLRCNTHIFFSQEHLLSSSD
ncbi:hypothetical protein EDC96DRAFT_543489 [Choanephora cucurbitarum]|nr:hypothetical protein EDC96DRAFT_543489 [Choanephora cucurbitarum]